MMAGGVAASMLHHTVGQVLYMPYTQHSIQTLNYPISFLQAFLAVYTLKI
jgi:hypothetical protein